MVCMSNMMKANIIGPKYLQNQFVVVVVGKVGNALRTDYFVRTHYESFYEQI